MPQMQRNLAKQEEMCALYRAGETLQQIGDRYGVTRERVRQIIRRAGMRRSEGGRARAVREKQQRVRRATDARKNARSQNKFGCTFAVARLLNEGRPLNAKGTPAAQFWQQKHNAEGRGISWEFTFPEWLDAWIASGHFHERGLGANKYVMARPGDVGPYRRDNVEFITHSQNSRDCRNNCKARKAANGE